MNEGGKRNGTTVKERKKTEREKAAEAECEA